VYIHVDRNKNSPRERYLVVSIDGDWCCVRKFVGNTLKANSYRLKCSEVYKVMPTTIPLDDTPIHIDSEEDDDGPLNPSRTVA
jgi:hypothetical protein